VSAITEWSLPSLLAIAEPIIPSLLDHKANRLQFDLEVDIFVGSITKWLRFRFAAETPGVTFVGLQGDFLGLLVVDYSVFWL
jgi:hypothetical protein